MTTLGQSPGAPPADSPRVHDREAELAMIDSVAERLDSGTGSVVVWLGEPGIGRSALLRTATDRISAVVGDVHHVNVSGQGVNGGPLAAIALVVHQILPLSPSVRSDALDRLLRPGSDDDGDPSELLRAAVHVVRLASRDRPLLVTVDDAPLAQDGNWAAVTSAAAQLASTRSAVLLTSGNADARRAPFTSAGPLWVRKVGPLPSDAAIAVVQESVPHFVPRSVAARLSRLLRGNPAAIKHACGVLSRDELLGLAPLRDPLPADPSTVEMYREWLEGLPPEHRTLLLTSALAVRPSAAVAENIAGAEIADVVGLEGEPWVRVRNDVLEFVDPRLRSAVVRSASHRQIAQAHAALAAASSDPVAALWHKGELGEPLGPDDVDLLASAAESALDGGDYEQAVRAARQALAAVPAGPQRVDLALTAGIAAYHQAYVGLAATLLHEATTDARTVADRYSTLAALCMSVAARDGSAPYALVDAALGPLGREAPAEAASLACLVARIAADSQQPELARTYLRQAETLASSVNVRAEAAGGTSERLGTELDHTRSWLGHAGHGKRAKVEHFSIVTTARPAHDLMGWDLAVRQVSLLARMEDWQQARFALAEVEGRQRRLKSPMLRAATVVTALDLHLDVGAVQEAHDLVSSVADALPIRLPFGGLGLCLCARIMTLTGQPTGAERWLESARRVAQSTGSPALLVRISAELALLASVRGDHDAAARLLSVAVQRASHFGHHDFAQLQLDLLEARHFAGVDTRTEEVMPVLEQSWGRTEATSKQRAMLAAARLLAAPRERMVAAALAAVDAAEWQVSTLWTGRVMRLAASVIAQLTPAEHEEQVRRLAVSDVPPDLEDHRRVLLQKASTHLTECGAIALAALAEASLESPVPTASEGDGEDSVLPSARLTPDEQRVAALVAGGASNRQVASTTYVSVRTVELRLTSIYRKLGIRSRKELADALIERGLPILPQGGRGGP